jgi:GNAT superfamily N-acetyltransferase
VLISEAGASDADAVSDVLQELVAAGKRTKAADASFVLSHYIRHPDRLHCLVAVSADGEILGFQSLKLAREGNPYDTPVGWGIVGTHVRPSAARARVGSRLFAATLAGARKAGLPAIEAYIGEQNSAALAYYDRLGFATCRCPAGIVCKALRLPRS